MSDLLNKLHTLTPQELRALKARVEVLLRGTSEKATSSNPNGLSDDAVLFYSILVDELRLRCVPETLAPKLGTLTHNPHFRMEVSMLRKHVEGFFMYVNQHIRPKNRAERSVATRFCIRMMLERVSFDKERLQLRVVLGLMPRVYELVENQFPAYHELGVLSSIVLRRQLPNV